MLGLVEARRKSKSLLASFCLALKSVATLPEVPATFTNLHHLSWSLNYSKYFDSGSFINCPWWRPLERAAMPTVLHCLAYFLCLLIIYSGQIILASPTSVSSYAQHLPQGVTLSNTVQNITTQDVKFPLQGATFKAYYPTLCQMLRKHAGIEEEQYIQNMALEKLFCFNSDSKSGQTFWVSHDSRIILKTIKHYECKTLKRIMMDYANHVFEDRSCIASILGFYRVQVRGKGCKYFLACVNVYPSDNSFIQSKWDLKGSTVGRRAHPQSTVKKDLDLIQSGNWIKLGPSRQLILHSLQRDVSFLSSHGFMDYSLLVAEEKQEPNTMLRFGPNPDVQTVRNQPGDSHHDLLSFTSLDAAEK